MKKEIGLWIDHRQAIVVTLLAHGEEVKRIDSTVEKHARFSGASHAQPAGDHDDTTEDKRDRRFNDHLDAYYDAVIATLHDADSVLIMGPGEAKTELHKRLEEHKVSGRQIIAVEAADKLTDGQIVAQVKTHFHELHSHKV